MGAAFFASELAVPLLVAAVTGFLRGAGFVDLGAAFLLITVVVLASLISLVTLSRRPMRVAGLEVGALEAAEAGARRVLLVAVVPVVVVLVVDVVVTFLDPVARADFAFSTKLESIFVAVAVRVGAALLRGEAGLAICDLAGDAGRSRLALRRELEDVGDRICAGRIGGPSLW